MHASPRTASLLAAALGLCAASRGHAVEVRDLEGFEALFGRYAPAGDCRREPRIIVDATGFTFDGSGRKVKRTSFEYAASFGPHDYAGGPPLSAFNASLVRGSPYRRCR